jgi:hypothetical protein
MRQTVIAVTIVLAAAASAAAQAPDHSVQVVSRTAIQQQRPQPRVLIQPGRDRRDDREEQSETFKKTVRLGGNGELDVSNITGDITIVRGGGNEATIEVTKKARAQTVEAARELLPLVKVEINERANRAEIRTLYPTQEGMFRNRRNINVSVHYVITTPAGTSVTAHSVTGNLRATEITGELSLATTSGNVQVVRGRNVESVKSTSGSVEVTDTDSETPIEAGTISGNVTIRQVKAPRMELGTVSGNVNMQDVQCGRLEAQSLSGDVEFAGTLVKGGRYEFNSHSGNVRIAVAPGTGFEVEANSWSGKVESDLQGLARHDDPRRGRQEKALRGVVGDGSAVLDITTFSGNVWIGRR